MSKLKSSFPAVLIILLVTLFAYYGLQESFFEQDEWHSFGYYNHLLTLSKNEFFKNILSNGPLSHFTPLSLFFKMSLYQFFGLNASLYFIVSILLHTLVSVAVYFLALQLTKRRLPSLIGALFFSINSSHYQAVTWLGTFEGAELATLFGVISILCLLAFLDFQKKKFLYLSIFAVLIALLFKETAVTFLFTLAVLIIFKIRGQIRRIAILNLGGATLLYILLRFSSLLWGVRQSEAVTGQSGGNILLMATYNIFTLPIKIFSQILLPNEAIISLTNIAATPFGLYQILGRGPWVLENGLRYDLVMIPVGIVIFLALYMLGKKSNIKFVLFLGLAIMFFALAPFLMMKKYLVYFDSRYLYTATVGFSLIISFIFADLHKAKIDFKNFFRYMVIPVILVAATALHMVSLRETITSHVTLGSMRKTILAEIYYENPNLPQKVVFYTESDTPYYGTSNRDRILPFQSGLGQTLLVYYQGKEKYPDKFFADFFLWEIDEQGYREEGGRGFGYYRDFDLLKKAVKQYNIPTQHIIAYSWTGNLNTLTNITDRIRVKLENEKN